MVSSLSSYSDYEQLFSVHAQVWADVEVSPDVPFVAVVEAVSKYFAVEFVGTDRYDEFPAFQGTVGSHVIVIFDLPQDEFNELHSAINYRITVDPESPKGDDSVNISDALCEALMTRLPMCTIVPGIQDGQSSEPL